MWCMGWRVYSTVRGDVSQATFDGNCRRRNRVHLLESNSFKREDVVGVSQVWTACQGLWRVQKISSGLCRCGVGVLSILRLLGSQSGILRKLEQERVDRASLTSARISETDSCTCRSVGAFLIRVLPCLLAGRLLGSVSASVNRVVSSTTFQSLNWEPTMRSLPMPGMARSSTSGGAGKSYLRGEEVLALALVRLREEHVARPVAQARDQVPFQRSTP